MPLVRHFELPSFAELEASGQTILSLQQATHQDIRELHVGLLNMMPDAALEVTERQFLRLVGNCNQIAQFYVHPFTLSRLSRSASAADYIARYYRSFAQVREMGLDALIITGANVTGSRLEEEPFWAELMEVASWASQSVTSVMCSCLASHALLQHAYGIERQPLEAKRWGVYAHHRSRLPHPLMRDINTRFDVPHSRWNTVSTKALEASGVFPLVVDENGEFHLAVSPDGLRVVYSQGHPEYDSNSLLKEYKREVLRFRNGDLAEYPPVPAHFLRGPALEIAERYRAEVLAGKGGDFPEDAIAERLDNTWGDTAKAVFNNWLGLVYQLTHVDRNKPFSPGVDPGDPIGWRAHTP